MWAFAPVCVFLFYWVCPLYQGEVGEAGDPGSVGEPGIAVSHITCILPFWLAQHHPFFTFSLFPFNDCHLICWRPRVLKAMWGRRVTLVLPVQLGLQDPEEHQARTDPKATLWVCLSGSVTFSCSNCYCRSVSLLMSRIWWFRTIFACRALLDSPEIQDPLENLATMWALLFDYFISNCQLIFW